VPGGNGRLLSRRAKAGCSGVHAPPPHALLRASEATAHRRTGSRSPPVPEASRSRRRGSGQGASGGYADRPRAPGSPGTTHTGAPHADARSAEHLPGRRSSGVRRHRDRSIRTWRPCSTRRTTRLSRARSNAGVRWVTSWRGPAAHRGMQGHAGCEARWCHVTSFE